MGRSNIQGSGNAVRIKTADDSVDLLTNIIELENIEMEAENGKAVLSIGNVLPEMSSSTDGKFLTNNGVDASWGDVTSVTANKDLSNLSATGEKHFLNYNQITNCIIETPQNLFWEEIENGVRLKAGSVVTFPDGFEEDGTTLKFKKSTTTQDIDITYMGSSSGNYTICLKSDLSNFYLVTSQSTSSGTTIPTSQNINFWYDTTTNNIKRYNSSGTLVNEGLSFPLGILNVTTKKLVQSFNHMGFIGSTVWVDKGVKGLIPKGRNADGSLKNIEYTTPTVLTRTWTTQTNNYSIYIYESDFFTYAQPVHILTVNNFGELPVLSSGSGQNAYVKDENIYYSCNSNTNYKWIPNINGSIVIVGNINIESGKVTKLTPVNTFRALDYNDQHLPQVDGQWTQSDATLADHVNITTTTPVKIDLSNYLPNDNYNYLIMLSVYISTGTTTAKLYIGCVVNSSLVTNTYLCDCINYGTGAANQGRASGYGYIPIGTDRKFNILTTTVSGFTLDGYVTLRAKGYRRIGTNL